MCHLSPLQAALAAGLPALVDGAAARATWFYELDVAPPPPWTIWASLWSHTRWAALLSAGTTWSAVGGAVFTHQLAVLMDLVNLEAGAARLPSLARLSRASRTPLARISRVSSRAIRRKPFPSRAPLARLSRVSSRPMRRQPFPSRAPLSRLSRDGDSSNASLVGGRTNTEHPNRPSARGNTVAEDGVIRMVCRRVVASSRLSFRGFESTRERKSPRQATVSQSRIEWNRSRSAGPPSCRATTSERQRWSWCAAHEGCVRLH